MESNSFDHSTIYSLSFVIKPLTIDWFQHSFYFLLLNPNQIQLSHSLPSRLLTSNSVWPPNPNITQFWSRSYAIDSKPSFSFVIKHSNLWSHWSVKSQTQNFHHRHWPFVLNSQSSIVVKPKHQAIDIWPLNSEYGIWEPFEFWHKHTSIDILVPSFSRMQLTKKFNSKLFFKIEPQINFDFDIHSLKITCIYRLQPSFHRIITWKSCLTFRN